MIRYSLIIIVIFYGLIFVIQNLYTKKSHSSHKKPINVDNFED